VGFVGPWQPPFLLLCFFDTFLPPAYPSCQPQIADLAKYTCPDCNSNAWAKPATRLICGECEVMMEAEELEEAEEVEA